MEEVREKLYQSIEENGIEALHTLELSQELDKYIEKEMKKQL